MTSTGEKVMPLITMTCSYIRGGENKGSEGTLLWVGGGFGLFMWWMLQDPLIP